MGGPEVGRVVYSASVPTLPSSYSQRGLTLLREDAGRGRRDGDRFHGVADPLAPFLKLPRVVRGVDLGHQRLLAAGHDALGGAFE